MQFLVKAVDSTRAIQQLRVVAGNAEGARQAAEHQGLRVLTVAPAQRFAPPRPRPPRAVRMSCPTGAGSPGP